MDELDDLVSTTSLSFLGMTVGCRACHNHKFDPIRSGTYYRLQRFSFPPEDTSIRWWTDELAAHKAEMRRIDKLQEPLKNEKRALEEPYRRRLFDEG